MAETTELPEHIRMHAQNGRFYNENDNTVNIADCFSNSTIGFEQINVAQTATKLTPATYQNAVKAVVVTESNAIRFRTDGSAPTTTSGILVPAGTSIELDGAWEIQHFQAISTSGVAVLDVEYKA